ncbi:MAG TPA: polysaccharide deacetylase family protein [Cyclobacteriaceae bacterium]|nr:polysaccharide deacetylase family protein [Cyclobacteriaceae bacterium]
MPNVRSVVLTFDVEEFDVPNEYGHPISLAEQIEISRIGTIAILDLLSILDVKATFFTTAQFALHAGDVVKRIASEGHEVASHSYFHDKFNDGDLLRSKLELEQISGVRITGFRMPQMMPVSRKDLVAAGYRYDSSIHPTYIPGRYNRLSEPRVIHLADGLVEVPASVTPALRFPLFWISLHVLPLWLYLVLCRRTLTHDGYLNLYLHPWEFVNLKDARYRLPWFMTKNSGSPLLDRLRAIIQHFKASGTPFTTMNTLVEKFSPFLRP